MKLDDRAMKFRSFFLRISLGVPAIRVQKKVECGRVMQFEYNGNLIPPPPFLMCSMVGIARLGQSYGEALRKSYLDDL